MEAEDRAEGHEAGLVRIASELDVEPGFLDELADTRKSAARAHRRISVGKIVLFGVGGAVVMGAGGWTAAPAIGAWLGSMAGLSGAVATGAGLAALGGGSLAAGGAWQGGCCSSPPSA